MGRITRGELGMETPIITSKIEITATDKAEYPISIHVPTPTGPLTMLLTERSATALSHLLAQRLQALKMKQSAQAEEGQA